MVLELHLDMWPHCKSRMVGMLLPALVILFGRSWLQQCLALFVVHYGLNDVILALTCRQAELLAAGLVYNWKQQTTT